MDFLLTENEDRLHCVLVKDFNRFMCDQTIHCHRKYFCYYCLQPFSSAEILERCRSDYFQINGNQMIKIPRMVTLLNSKNLLRKKAHRL